MEGPKGKMLAAVLAAGLVTVALMVYELQRWAHSVDNRWTRQAELQRTQTTAEIKRSADAISSQISQLNIDERLERLEQRLTLTIAEMRQSARAIASQISSRANIDAQHTALDRLHPNTIVDTDTYDQLDRNWRSEYVTTDRVPLPCQSKMKQAVIVTLGQSNASNTGHGPIKAGDSVVNFNLYDGKCYQARDPLLGASNDGANFATRLGLDLTESKQFDRVVIAPIAMGGTSIQHWSPPGVFNRRILVLIKRLYDAGLKPDFILWHQGEANVDSLDVNGAIYSARLSEVISTFRIYGIDAPFFVAQASYCGGPRAGSESVRTAQRQVGQLGLNAFPGPDTDALGEEYRYDHCHFNEKGTIRHAELWAQILTSFLKGQN